VEFETAIFDQRKAAYEKLLPLMRVMNVAGRNSVIRQLREWSGNIVPRRSHRMLSESELKKFGSSSSVVIGAHTVSHQSLAALPKEEQFSEIAGSKNLLQDILGKPVIDFSYPFGTRNDYSEATIDICRQLGFSMVAANYPYIVNSRSNVFEFPRFLIRNWDKNEFAGHLKSFLH
jgi:peptidoglycan/xylan/chitin deacetylase (PgdA/CDA1 family)